MKFQRIPGRKDVYDNLAVTGAGDLLTDIYLESREFLVVEQAGGAQAKVQEVIVELTEPRRAGQGYVFHTTWKITGMEVLDEVRLDPGAG